MSDRARWQPIFYWNEMKLVWRLATRPGDRETAQKLAARIPWQPSGPVAKALALRAKAESKTVEGLRLEALTEGLLRVMQFIDHPLMVDQTGLLVAPKDSDFSEGLAWVVSKAVQAAERWLLNRPYTPQSRATRKRDRVIPEKRFRTEYPLVYSKLRAESSDIPTQAEVAAWFGIGEKTLRNWLNDYNLPWPP